MFLPRRSCPVLSWTAAAALSSHLTQLSIYLLVVYLDFCIFAFFFVFLIFPVSWHPGPRHRVYLGAASVYYNKALFLHNDSCIVTWYFRTTAGLSPFWITFHLPTNTFSVSGQIRSLFIRNAFSSILAASTCSTGDCHHPWASQCSPILRHRPGCHLNPQFHSQPISHL